MDAKTLLSAVGAVFSAHGDILTAAEHEGETLLAEEIPALVESQSQKLDAAIAQASADTGIPVADFDQLKTDVIKATQDFLEAKAGSTVQPQPEA